MRAVRRRNGGVVSDIISASGQLDRAGRRRGAGGGALGDGDAGGAGGGGRHRQARPLPRRLRESRTQAPDGSVRDDGHPGAGGVGGRAADGPQAAVVLHRRRARPAGAAQAHPAALPAAAPTQPKAGSGRELSCISTGFCDVAAFKPIHAKWCKTLGGNSFPTG